MKVMMDPFESTIEEYRILEPIGPVKGCNTFKAVSAQGDRFVAIKIFPHEISQNRVLMERLRISIQSVYQLNHPSILPILNFGIHVGRPYLVMPFMGWGSLQDRINCGALPTLDAEVVIRELVSALEFAHSKGLVHGNLKPSTILFNEEGTVQLNGLGEAPLTRARFHQPNNDPDGSFYYRAPEARASGEITPLADQYSLGLIVLQILTNLPIIEIMKILDFNKRQDSGDITKTTFNVLDLPKKMTAVLLRALSRDPSQRFPSIRVMHQAFVAALNNQDFQLEVESKSNPKVKSELPVKRQRTRWVVLVPILALVFSLVVAIPALSSGQNGLWDKLISILGRNVDGSTEEVVTTNGNNVGGITLPTGVASEKDFIDDDAAIKMTKNSASPTVMGGFGSTTNAPTNTPVPPDKTNLPNQPAGTPSSTDQPIVTATLLQTETLIPTSTEDGEATLTPSPTDTKILPNPTEQQACKKNAPPGNRHACTPTPTPQ